MVWPRKDQWVIHRRVRFDLENLTAVGQRVADCTVYLRNAAQGIGILHATALAMGLANLAAFEHFSQIGRGLDLSCMRARPVNAFVEGHIGAAQASSVMAPITSAESTNVSAASNANVPTPSIAWVPLIRETASLASSASGLI